MRPPRLLSFENAMYYEIAASWWARRVSNPYLQDKVSQYFQWKVNRKYKRYYSMFVYSKEMDKKK